MSSHPKCASRSCATPPGPTACAPIRSFPASRTRPFPRSTRTSTLDYGYRRDAVTNGDHTLRVSLIDLDTDADDAADELLLTLAVRSGAGFAGSPSPTATIDGIVYQIQGSLDLAGFSAAVEGPLASPVVPSLLPALPPSGYEYRTFRLAGSNGLPGRGFVRAVSSAAP